MDCYDRSFTTNAMLAQLGYKTQSLFVTNKFSGEKADVYSLAPGNGFISAAMSDESPVRVSTAAFMLFAGGVSGARSIEEIQSQVRHEYGEYLGDMVTFLRESGLDARVAEVIGKAFHMECTKEQAIEVVINGVDDVLGQENVQRAIDDEMERVDSSTQRQEKRGAGRTSTMDVIETPVDMCTSSVHDVDTPKDDKLSVVLTDLYNKTVSFDFDRTEDADRFIEIASVVLQLFPPKIGVHFCPQNVADVTHISFPI